MKNYTVVIDVKLAYKIKAKNEEEAIMEVENVELPKEYVEDSFEIAKIIKN